MWWQEVFLPTDHKTSDCQVFPSGRSFTHLMSIYPPSTSNDFWIPCLTATYLTHINIKHNSPLLIFTCLQPVTWIIKWAYCEATSLIQCQWWYNSAWIMIFNNCARSAMQICMYISEKIDRIFRVQFFLLLKYKFIINLKNLAFICQQMVKYYMIKLASGYTSENGE